MYVFVDSMKLLLDKGYENPGLDTFSDSRQHSAIHDVKLIRHVVTKLDIATRNGRSLDNISQYLSIKLPLTIPKIYNLATQASSRLAFEIELRRAIRKKTALNEKQICKIATYYYK